MIKVVVNGVGGKMGKIMLENLAIEKDIKIVGAVDINNIGKSLYDFIPLETLANVFIQNDLSLALDQHKPDVMLDFTTPRVVYNNTMICLQKRVRPVVGTTGLTSEQFADIGHLALENNIGALIAPNFAIGAILLMRFAAQAAKYFPAVEIIELHHDQKIDAPSGTALKTIEAMQPYPLSRTSLVKEIEIVSGSRGGLKDGVRVHSVRLPGFVAHEEVIFGALGQSLTIRHDSISRESFYPGVILAIRNVMSYIGLKVGIDSFLE